jgi:hypothetical protein
VEDEGEIDLANRVGLSELLVHARNKEVFIVVVDLAARLTKHPFEQMVLLRQFRSMGVRVIEASTSKDLTDDYLDTLTVRFNAEEETAAARSKLQVLNWRGTLLQNKTRVGRKAFGEGPEKSVMIRIFQLCRKLPKDQRRKRSTWRSFKQIADILNEEKLPSRTGKPWTSATVRGIVKRTRPDLIHKWSGRRRK